MRRVDFEVLRLARAQMHRRMLEGGPMQRVKVGMTVQFFTSKTRDERGSKLEEPIPFGPLAGIVIGVDESNPEMCDINVWMPGGRLYPAFRVTREPTTPVRHWWRFVEEDKP